MKLQNEVSDSRFAFHYSNRFIGPVDWLANGVACKQIDATRGIQVLEEVESIVTLFVFQVHFQEN